MRSYRHSRARSSRGHVRTQRSPQWTRWGVWAGAAVALIAGLLLIRQVLRSTLKDEKVPQDNRTWLEYAWTTNPVNADAVKQLGQRLKSNEISRVYLEASAWRGDGSLVEGPYTADFVQQLRGADPGVGVLLWLRMSADQIAQPAARMAALELAGKAVRDWKLDGVQLNGRAVVNGNETYIQLLRDLRDTIGESAVLSVTVPPDRIPTDPDVPLVPTADPALTWDVNYKQRVGLLLIDEIVVMAHASELEDTTQYETWVAYQVESYAQALAELEHPSDIIVALPTYDAAPGHDPAVENMRPAIAGVHKGVQQAGNAGKWVKGVGLYEYKTTDSLEWELYRQNWLGKKK